MTSNTDQPSVTSSDAGQVQGRVTSHREKTQALLAKAQELLDAGDEAGAEPLIRQVTSTAELHALAGDPIERYEGLSDVLIEKLRGNPFLESSSQAAPTSSAVAQKRVGPVREPSIVQVEAAKLRLVTDKRLGKQSPEWLQRVAKGLPPQIVKAAG